MQRLALVVALLSAVALVAVAQAAEPPKISVEATDTPVAEVVARIQAQAPEVQLCLMAGATAELKLSLQAVSLQEAVTAVAQALKGSMVRGYIIEKVGPGETPYTGAEFLDYLKSAREEWRKRLTPEQKKSLEDRLQAQMARMQQTGKGMPRVDVLGYDDPLMRLAILPTAEKLTVKLQEQPLQAALDAFMFESGYTVLLEEGVTGAVTLEATDQELGAVLDKLAAAGQAKWRMFYLISEPVKLSEADAEKRADQIFGEMWGGFWSETPERRAELMQRMVQNLNAMPPERLQMAKTLPFATKMFTRLMRAVPQLTPAQRREFLPVIQAVGKIMGQ